MRITVAALLVGILLAGCTGTGGASERDLTPREARAAVVETVDPGTCFGMPGPVTEETKEDALQRNPDLAAFIRERFDTAATGETYERLRQYQQVILHNASAGYRFSVEDGRCCEIKTINGTVVGGREPRVRFGANSTRTVPC